MKVIYYAFLALILTGVVAYAQSKDSDITLDVAVKLALDKNLTVEQAVYAVQRAQANHVAAVGKFLPNLSFGIGYSHQGLWHSGVGIEEVNNVPIQVSGTSYQDIPSWSTGLSANITLFNGFGNNYNLTSVDESKTSADLALTRTQQNTVFQVNTLFLTVVRDGELLKVAQDNLKSSQEQLQRIQESEKVGSLALADVYRQQTTVEQNELAVIQANANFEKAKLDVLNFLGVPTGGEYNFDFAGVPTDIDSTQFGPLNQQYADLQGLVTDAIAKRPDYLSNVAALNSAVASVSFAKSAYWPTITASASYGLDNSAIAQITDDRSLSLNLNLSVPIFNGFLTQTQIDQAEINKDNADEMLKQNERQVIVDVRKAKLDLEAAEEEVISTVKGVISSDLDRQTAQEKYNLGSNTLLDVLTAVANYTTALSNKVNAVNDFLLAKKELEYALGTIKN